MKFEACCFRQYILVQNRAEITVSRLQNNLAVIVKMSYDGFINADDDIIVLPENSASTSETHYLESKQSRTEL